MPSHSKSAFAGAACITGTLLGWASVPLFLKYFTQEGHALDAWTANGWRYAISAFLLTPVMLTLALRRTLPSGLWRRAVVPSLFNCAGQICFAWAPYFIGPGLMAFLLRFQIIFVALGAYLLFPSERHVLKSRIYWVGVLLVLGGLAGTVIMGDRALSGTSAFGVALGIASGVLFAGYALSVRYFMHGIGPVVSFGAISQLTAGTLLVIMLIISPTHGAGALQLPVPALGMLVISSVIGIALGHIFYYAAIARLGVSISGGVILLAPVITAVSSFFIYDERLTTGQWISGTTALLGALLVVSRQARYTSRVVSAGGEQGPRAASGAAALAPVATAAALDDSGWGVSHAPTARGTGGPRRDL